MKKLPQTNKKSSHKKEKKIDDYKNKKNKIVYFNHSDSQIIIGYDEARKSKYIQINNLQ